MTNSTPKPVLGDAAGGWRQSVASLLFGLWLAIVPVKFGNPVIFEQMIGAPEGLYAFLLSSWPVSWSYAALGITAIAALLVSRWRWSFPSWLLALPLVWLGWNLVSATQSVHAGLTQLALLQFGGCVLCFHAGFSGLSEVRDWRPLWLGLAVGLTVILGTALHQRFGGLEEMRRYVEANPEQFAQVRKSSAFWQRLASERIYGTFVYPNALAGGLLLLLPVTLVGICQSGRSFAFRSTIWAALGLAGLASLYWSGSKSGWLIALVLLGLGVWRLPARLSFKAVVMIGLVSLGIAAFVGRHGAYFEKGASSLSARLDYWRAGVRMVEERPLLGFGPGTFQLQYAAIKPPNAEMAKLAHNDYLQQGTDGGLPALIAYTTFILGSVLLLYRRSKLSHPRFAAWLGVFAFAAQGATEFGLYIPGLAWPFFLFTGWLWGAASNQIDNGVSPSYPVQAKK